MKLFFSCALIFFADSLFAKIVQVYFIDAISKKPIPGVLCTLNNNDSIIGISNGEGVATLLGAANFRIYKQGYKDTLIYISKNTQIKLSKESCYKNRTQPNPLSTYLNSISQPTYKKRVFVFSLDSNLKDTTAISFFDIKFQIDKNTKRYNQRLSLLFNKPPYDSCYDIKVLSVSKYMTNAYYQSDQILGDHLNMQIDSSDFNDLYANEEAWGLSAKKEIIDSCNKNYYLVRQDEDANTQIQLKISSSFFDKNLVCFERRLNFKFDLDNWVLLI